MSEKNKPRGRPPAEWMLSLAKNKFPEDKDLTIEEASDLFNISKVSFYKFCKRVSLKSSYKNVGGTVKNTYSLATIQKAVTEHVEKRI